MYIHSLLSWNSFCKRKQPWDTVFIKVTGNNGTSLLSLFCNSCPKKITYLSNCVACLMHSSEHIFGIELLKKKRSLTTKFRTRNVIMTVLLSGLSKCLENKVTFLLIKKRSNSFAFLLHVLLRIIYIP